MSILKIDEAKSILYTSSDVAFYTAILMFTRINAMTSISTAATDGKDIFINPKFWDSLPNGSQQAFALVHEVRHIIDRHTIRRPKVAGACEEVLGRIWNVACDVRINNDLKKIGCLEFIPGIVDMPQYDGLSAEEVFWQLWKDPKMQAAAASPNGQLDDPDGKGTAGKGKSFDPVNGGTPIEDHLLDPSGDPDVVDIEIQQRIIAAVSKCKDAGNHVPPDYALFVENLMKPAVDYRKLVAKFVGGALKRETNYSRPMKQLMGVAYLPSLTKPAIDEMVWVVDVSGSTVDYFQEFISEVAGIFGTHPQMKIHVIQFDSIVQSIDTVKSLKDLLSIKFNGGGGTQIVPPLEAAALIKNAPCVFIVTDGYFWESDYPILKKPTCWVVWDNPKFKPKFGTVVHFQPKGKQ